MTLILLEGPALEPVTLAQARAYLRLDATDEDTLVPALISVARTSLETELRRAFISQRWTLLPDRWPGSSVTIPLTPVQSIDAVRVSGITLAADSYACECRRDPAVIHGRAGMGWPLPADPAGGIEIDFTAGYGDAADDVPAPVRQAILMLAAHWFETREPVAMGTPVLEMPFTVSRLIEPYRRPRL
ncbi:MAG: head-tail connector protein [Parvibaculaceae bacterium]|nr:head-tail connector protein [Parvibaculaceae bacterium]